MPSAALPRTTVLLEVACDESGSEGEKLVRGSTDTFAHASVDVTTAAAVGDDRAGAHRGPLARDGGQGERRAAAPEPAPARVAPR